jgi:hypothetical protein
MKSIFISLMKKRENLPTRMKTRGDVGSLEQFINSLAIGGREITLCKALHY